MKPRSRNHCCRPMRNLVGSIALGTTIADLRATRCGAVHHWRRGSRAWTRIAVGRFSSSTRTSRGAGDPARGAPDAGVAGIAGAPRWLRTQRRKGARRQRARCLPTRRLLLRRLLRSRPHSPTSGVIAVAWLAPGTGAADEAVRPRSLRLRGSACRHRGSGRHRDSLRHSP